MPRRGSESVRRLPFLAWENDLAWVNAMKGSRWRELLRRERATWNSLVHQPAIRSKIPEYERELQQLTPYQKIEAFRIADNNIVLSPGFYWRWKWDTKWHEFDDIDYADNHLWITTTCKRDEYKSILTCMRLDGKVIWTKDYVNGQVAVRDGLCYFVGVKYPFHTDELFVCDAFTGKNEEVLKVERDVERFMGLIRTGGRTLYLQSGTWEESRVWRVEGRKLVPVFDGTEDQILLGRAPTSEREECAFVRYADGRTERIGKYFRAWKMPKEEPNWISLHSGLVLTVKDGGTTLWKCSAEHAPKKLHSIVGGEIAPNPWAEWMDEILYSFIVWSPEGPPYLIRYEPDDGEMKRLDPPFGTYEKGRGKGRRATFRWKKAVPPPPLDAKLYHTTSADGTRVPWLLVHQKGVKKVRGLLGYVYAAYGSETVVNWPHLSWSPLLRRGWAIAYSFARGSGDNGAEWTDAGQRENHVRTIEDFEATVRAAQTVTGLGPRETVIYGRSAGGMMMGIMTQRHRDGDLMGAVYTEVPFVDTLWTQTNYDVPLTPSGMSEYGNPAKSVRDFAAMMALSPMYQLDADGAPGVFVLCRTGLKDQQVFPSEPFKWIQRLRGAGIRPPAGKYLAFEEGEAHVYKTKRTVARATDLAVLETWLQNKIAGSDIKMANMQRKKQQQKKQQEGGRRRRTVRRHRAARKTRRHHRRQ
jgi:hypothetical protein